MRKEILITLLILGITAQAKAGLTTQSKPASVTQIQLLTTNSEGFDFRDENNQPIDGNKDEIESLFLSAAWNLLVLGQTIPKVIFNALLDGKNDWLGRLRLTAKKQIQKFTDWAALMKKSWKQRFSTDKTQTVPPASNINPNRSLHNQIPASFAGAATPLRI